MANMANATNTAQGTHRPVDGLVYVEFVSRRPGVDLHDFHTTMEAAHGSWSTGHGEDVLLWAGARTWRIGPEPEHLTIWYSPGFGLGRLDGWDRLFRAGEAERHAQTVGRVARIERAGCYRPLREPVAVRQGTPGEAHGVYYVEFFAARETLPVITSFYAARARRLVEGTLNLLAYRIGGLAPDPGGIALWTVPSFAALEDLAGSLDTGRDPIGGVMAGTYTDVGREIL